ncbi:MAG TPA: hypothetical protein VF939_00495 [Puia sp.]
MKKRILQFGAGLIFSVLWSSASTATKIGLQAPQPFVLSVTRFFLAGLPLLQNSSATPGGLLILVISMLAFSLSCIRLSDCECSHA